MKKILFFALALLAVVACSKFDDSAIWEELDKHEDRIVKLETLCNQMNTNITSLQTIIIALQSNDYVVNIAPIMEGNKEIGYTITFAKSGSITIYHGKDGKDGANGADGKDGQNGTDGKDGKDGYTPKIGVKQHTDGRYYWTLDGTWLLDDNGNMIPATGEDGKDGTNGSDGKDGQNGEDGTNGADGKDGITPQLKIEDGYWYLSYDNGATWQKLGKATGNNGLDGLPGADGADGEDGDNIIDSITQDDKNVYFNLSDGTIITLSKKDAQIILFKDLSVKGICCSHWDSDNDGELSYSEANAITDISDFFTMIKTSAYRYHVVNQGYKTVTTLITHGNPSITSFEPLKYFTSLTSLSGKAFSGDYNLCRIELPEGLLEIQDGYKAYITYPKETNNYGEVSIGIMSRNVGAFSYTSISSITLPASLKKIGQYTFAGCDKLQEIRSYAQTPPTLSDEISSEVTVYVPSGCIPAYKADSNWKTAKDILEISE